MSSPPLVHDRRPDASALVPLYDAVGWTAYTRDPDALARAVGASHHVCTAWDGDTLVGLCRWLSDDVAIAWLQDVLVLPTWQRTGLGRRLVDDGLTRYRHVRSIALMTDDRPAQHAFYAAMGFVDVRDRPPLHAFVRLRPPA
ncbi:MAG: GNAT family N-acetyltransferase [Alphaproteobacteria bacterium]|nr:GNAT family N-acetyltransferase [Alphaproteobacteria bacterium]